MCDASRRPIQGGSNASKRPWIMRAVALAVILGALVWLVLRRPAEQMVHITGSTMGTTYSVRCVLDRAWAADGTFREALADAIQQALDDVNQRMSTYQPDSELSRLNAYVGVAPYAVSPPLLHVLERAMAVSEASGGAFDITVGPVVNAYGFGPESQPVALPSDEQIEKLTQRIGYRMIHIGPTACTVTKERPDLYLDLSAIAKGYAVDQVAAVLDGRGIYNYMVEVGGEVRVAGCRSAGALWRLGVEKPRTSGRSIYRVLELTDVAMATSGDYRNYYEREGHRVSHTIDPRTGRPVTHALASVTVLSEDCETADAWATALMVLGPEQGYNLAEQRALAAMFLVREVGDVLTEKSTSGFSAMMSVMRPCADVDRAPGRSGAATSPAR